MTEILNLYCERLGPGLWAEPLNALSNLAFVIAAIVAWRRLRGRPAVADLRLLASLIACVAVGSFAFHTLAQRWTLYLDTGSITVFLLAYLHRFLVRRAGLGAPAAGAGVLVFLGVDLGLPGLLSGAPLNGSEFYAGAVLALSGAALWSRWRRLPGGRALSTALLLFIVSLFARSLDLSLCPEWPVGTHFLWHLLNAVVLDRLMCGLSAEARAGAPVGGSA